MSKGGEHMLSERITMIRKHFSLSQKEFGEIISLTQNHISSIENGRRNATERVLNDISREFNVNINWLLNGEEPIFNDLQFDKHISHEAQVFTKDFMKLKPEHRKIINDMMDTLLKTIEETSR